MNINKHNCEAFFLDYYDKKLNPVEVAELLCFLEEHPDLKELFESYEEIQAVDESIHYHDKEALKKKYSPEEIERILSSGINTSNCEYFFVANAEGILSAAKLKELHAFLDKHPELKKEQELFFKCRLPVNETFFIEKAGLKQTGITLENKEEYFARSVDKDLSRAEEEQLSVFLAQHPEFKKEYALFKQTILSVENVVFENKEALKKQKHRPVVIPLFYQRVAYYAAAASVLLLAGLFFFSKESISVPDQGIAYSESNTATTPATVQPVQQYEKNITSEQPAIASAQQQAIVFKPAVTHVATTLVQTTLAANSIENNDEKVILQPFIVEDETNLLAHVEPVTLLLTQEEEITTLSYSQELKHTNTSSAIAAQASSSDDYQTVGAFTRKKIKKALGIDKASPCQPDDKISMWDVVVAAKNGLQKATGSMSLEVNKICNDEGGKVEYIFAAGNLRITRSASK